MKVLIDIAEQDSIQVRFFHCRKSDKNLFQHIVAFQEDMTSFQWYLFEQLQIQLLIVFQLLPFQWCLALLEYWV